MMFGYYFKVLRTFSFKGRARRAEYWFFTIFNVVVDFALRMASGLLGLMLNVSDDGDIAVNNVATQDSLPILSSIYAVLIVVQSIAVTVRRFHDRNMSAWWVFGFFLLAIAVGIYGGFAPQYAQMGLVVVGAFGFAGFVITVLPGTNGPNSFGPDPKVDPAETTAETFT